MWKLCLELSEDKTKVIARLPGEVDLGGELNQNELNEQLVVMNAERMFVVEGEVVRFINCAKERKAEAYEGIVIAEKRNAQVQVELSNNDMLASMNVVGAYGGRGLRGPRLFKPLLKREFRKVSTNWL